MLLIGCSNEDLKQLEQSNKELKTIQKIYSEKEGSQDIYDKIEVGMSMEKVKKIAGEPLKNIQMESYNIKREIWYYEGKISVTFLEGYVEGKAKY
jgi:hypothetical protein